MLTLLARIAFEYLFVAAFSCWFYLSVTPSLRSFIPASLSSLRVSNVRPLLWSFKDNRGIWAPSKNYSDAPFFCPNHECERAEYERSKEMTRLLDISQGRERVKIPLDLAVESTEAGRDPKDGVVLPQTCPSLECYVSSLPLPQGILLKHRGELEFKYVASVVDR